jgi:hypothetical protein
MFLASVASDLQVIDSGAAKIKTIDRQWHADYAAQHGHRAMRSLGINAMEADWVITKTGFVYVNPRLRFTWGWRWDTTTFEVIKRGRRSAAIGITGRDGQHHVMQLGSPAADNIVAAATLGELLHDRHG